MGRSSPGAKFDPYHRWLGIPPAEQPPTPYRLLGLSPLEGDPDVIEEAADRQMAHIKAHQGGSYAAESQVVLNELAAAKLLLLNAERKAEYDRLHLAAAASSHAPAQPIPITPQVMSLPRAISQPMPLGAIPSAPAAEPLPARRTSIATERSITNERTKTPFYGLITKRVWTIGVCVPLCIIACGVFQRYRLSRPFRVLAAARPIVESDAAPIESVPLPANILDEGEDQPSVTEETSARPAPQGARPPTPPSAALYPLTKLRFLDWINGTWENDIYDRFEVSQIGSVYLIKCDIPDGYEHKLIVFHEENPAEKKLSVKFQLNEGRVFFDFRPGDLSPRGERVNGNFQPGVLYSVEMWLDNGIARATINGHPAEVQDDPTCNGYFAIVISGRCELKIFDLRCERRER